MNLSEIKEIGIYLVNNTRIGHISMANLREIEVLNIVDEYIKFKHYGWYPISRLSGTVLYKLEPTIEKY